MTRTHPPRFRTQAFLVQDVDQVEQQMLQSPQPLIWNPVAPAVFCFRNLDDVLQYWTKPRLELFFQNMCCILGVVSGRIESLSYSVRIERGWSRTSW